MKFIYLFLSFVSCKNIPLCRNCIYYKPNFIEPNLNMCTKFIDSEKITTNIKTYNSVDICRNDETKCGKEGNYFKKDKNINININIRIIKFLPHIMLILSIIVSSLLNIYIMNLLIRLK